MATRYSRRLAKDDGSDERAPFVSEGKWARVVEMGRAAEPA